MPEEPLSAWRPSARQGALIVDLCELLAARAPRARELLQTAATEVADCFGDSCIATLLSDDPRWLAVEAVADPDAEVAAVLAQSLAGARLRADRGFFGPQRRTREPVRLAVSSPELMLAARPELRAYVERFGVRGVLFAPMRSSGAVVGQLAVLRRRDVPAYTADDERFAQVVADWLALAIGGCSHRASRPCPEGDPALPGITAREREILALLALGHTNREVAGKLHLSVRTVEWHRLRLRSKLGVSGRAALAGLARERGLID